MNRIDNIVNEGNKMVKKVNTEKTEVQCIGPHNISNEYRGSISEGASIEPMLK